MALVSAKTAGSNEIKQFDVATVGALKDELNLGSYSAFVNGTAQGNDFELSTGDLVTFGASVKGGNK